MKSITFTGSPSMLKSLVLISLTMLAFCQLQAQTDRAGYAPKVAGFGNLWNQLRTDSAQHVPHKYGLTMNTTDSTPQLFAWSTSAGDSLILFVNGRYIIIGAGSFVANVGGAVSLQSGPLGSLPLPGTYGRFYTAPDSARLLFDNGTAWVNLSGGGPVKLPSSFDTLIIDPAVVRDTSITFDTCGVHHCGYAHFSLPQYVGLHIQVFVSGIATNEGFRLACIFGWAYTWNSSTGDLYIWGAVGDPGAINYHVRAVPNY